MNAVEHKLRVQRINAVRAAVSRTLHHCRNTLDLSPSGETDDLIAEALMIVVDEHQRRADSDVDERMNDYLTSKGVR
jgi:uncharacterized protein YxjI